MPQVGVDRFETRGARHIISHTMEMMLAAMSVIWGGVCDRHPRLRIAFLESGGGWIAPWLDRMDQQAAQMKVDAWKGYTGAAPKGFDRGWFVDDEKIAYPMLERARKLGVRRVCLHKGLPLGPVADFNHPRDLIKAARDFPDIDFLAYHAGLLTVPAGQAADVPWTTEFCQMKKKEPGLRNIYMIARFDR